MTKLINVNLIPDYAEIADPSVQRATAVTVPPGTSPDAAQKAVRERVDKWLDWLRDKEFLVLASRVHIKGPRFNPYPDVGKPGLDVFGEDLYLCAAQFKSAKPRRVPRALIVGNRRLAEKVGMSREEVSAPVSAIPDDLDSQMANVKKNPEKVRDDLADLAEKANNKEAHYERFG